MRSMSVEPKITCAYKIRNLDVNPGLVLAPMSGVTTSAFRRLIRELNPGAVGLVVSEFISVEGLTRNSTRSKDMMRFRELERPFGIQIFGWDIERMRDAALMAEEVGADLLDINCGCPAPKVVKRGGGCELMRQPEHLQKLVSEVRKAIKIPLTLKMRAGWEDSNRNALEISKIVVGEGVEGLAIHGRTRAQLYRGLADWDVARTVAQEVTVPVCGSGDIVDGISAQERLQGGIAGLFIGRGAIANPFIFSDLVHGTKTDLRNTPELALKVLARYIELLKEDFPDKASIGKVKQLASQMGKGFRWRKTLCQVMTLAEQVKIIENELLVARQNPSELLTQNQAPETIQASTTEACSYDTEEGTC